MLDYRRTRLALLACGFLIGGLLVTAPSFAQTAPQDLASDLAPVGEDDEPDANLVPLEPELTIAVPETPQGSEITVGTADSTSQPQPAPSVQAAANGGTIYNIPVVIDPTVQNHIRFFNTSIRSRFEQWLVRLSRYRPIVENIFSE